MSTRKKALIGTAVIFSSLGLFVLALYLWPLQSQALKRADIQAYTYDQNVTLLQYHIQDEELDPALKPDCRSQLLTHGRKTARAVVMFPGFRNCPAQFSALAKSYYDKGYNVYVPLVRQFGTRDGRGHAKITADSLVGYANQSVNLTSGLGDEVGTVGLSGGGVLATWSALFRSDIIKRALIISPFYEPHSSQLPKWLVKPFVVLYGFSILPDYFNADQSSYRALAQYARVTANLQAKDRPQLVTASLVLSGGDDQIDHDVARALMHRLFENPVVYVPPAEWGLKHDIVDPTSADINGHAADLYLRYLWLYEGDAAQLKL